MRASLLLLAAASIACGASASENLGDGDGDGSPAQDADSCFIDADCQLVASSCCECPTFAAGLGFADSCEEVECPGLPECAPTAARCVAGFCTFQCSPVIATQTCESGFGVDAAGCTVDECATDIAPECALDVECIVVPADCCGCDQGGNDTAVAASLEADHLAGLMCQGPASCPGVSSCDDSARAGCIAGQCRYLTGSLGDPVFCGTLESGPCEAGFECVLNGESADGTVISGVGVCQPE